MIKMTETRTPKKTLEKIMEVSKETNPFLALAGVIEIIENCCRYEKMVPVEFDSKTGMPLKFEWKPVESYEPLKVSLDYKLDDKEHKEKGKYVAFDIDRDSIPLNQDVIDYLFFDLHIEKKPFIINMEREYYAVGYKENKTTSYHDEDTYIYREIYFQKLSGILTKEGMKTIKLAEMSQAHSRR